MPCLTRSILALALLSLCGTGAEAHYNMLLPQAASVKRSEPVTLVYQWGHPFEHELFDAPRPESISVQLPDGKKVDLAPVLEKIAVSATGGHDVTAYRVPFRPEQRGDYLFTLATPPIWMPEDEEFLQDTVKVVLHVQVQKGWDASAGKAFEIVPLTRPYGLEPGMVFQAQVVADAGPVPGTLVEIEPYHAMPPQTLPADEQITRTAKTDPAGVATCTLTDAGWWCLTAQRDGGQKDHDGRSYPVKKRTTLWVFVDEKVKPEK